MCYGMDLARKDLAERGVTAGIIAAQSIGEPGTQLTMRTFHIGGVAIGGTEESEMLAKRAGTVRFEALEVVQDPEGRHVSISRHGEIVILDDKGRELDRHSVPMGAEVLVREGKAVKEDQKLVQWDLHFTPILAEVSGKARYEDIVEGKTLKVERDETHGISRSVIMEHKGDMHPQILIEGKDGNILSLYPLPEKAIVEVENGQQVTAGTRLARTLREVQRTQDITGGLPRVTELFEARTPKDPAVMSEIDGVVTDIERRRGRTIIKVEDPDTGYHSEHTGPAGKHMRVNRGDRVAAGQALVDGPLVLDDMLRISGEEALHNYMLQEIQNVYRTQDATIDDKHFEIIISQMTRRVKVKEPGDTKLLPEQLVDKFEFRDGNQRIITQAGQPATAESVIMGITKAALSSESFISAASFQNTTRVLTRAALAGAVDRLAGLKENVILGHLIPSGTGFKLFYNAELKRLEAPAQPKELEEPARKG
jgi:DNA-directed RNA polymerase subunit beta'